MNGAEGFVVPMGHVETDEQAVPAVYNPTCNALIVELAYRDSL